ncbi:MAG: hypothetical protein ACXW1C_00960 [Gallionella sp.]
MMLTDVAGLFGHASLIAASTLLIPAVRRLPAQNLSRVLAVIFLVALIPFNGLPLAAYTRGMVGDLSITSVALIWLAMLRPYGIVASAKSRSQLFIFIAVIALIFYPLTLGLSMSDPYRMAYGDTGFFSIALLVALFAWWWQSNLIVLCLTLATLAWSLGIYESSNAWDYFIDPLLAGYALFYAGKFASRKWTGDKKG